MTGPRLFSSPRAYDEGTDASDLLETGYIEMDGSDYGAERYPTPAENEQAAKRITRRRAQAELRRGKYDFSQLMKFWR